MKYTAIHKDAAVRGRSSSGGAFSCITDALFDSRDNVVVWGCVLDSDQRAVHIRATDKSGRDGMCGSKYISSDPGTAFQSVLADLTEGKYVVFSGTPCQVAGLKSFLSRKGADTDNLLTVDFVCHGVGSNTFFEDYLKHFEKKYKSKVVQCKFRAHSKPGKKQDMELVFKNGKKYNAPSTRDDWFYSIYINNLILRPSCYRCKYASEARVSDITLADDWSAKGSDRSMILFNTPQGLSLLPQMKASMDLSEMTGEQNVPNLHRPTPRPAGYADFWETYTTKGYLAAQRRLGNHTLKGRIRFRLAKIADKLNLRRWIKGIGRK